METNGAQQIPAQAEAKDTGGAKEAEASASNANGSSNIAKKRKKDGLKPIITTENTAPQAGCVQAKLSPDLPMFYAQTVPIPSPPIQFPLVTIHSCPDFRWPGRYLSGGACRRTTSSAAEELFRGRGVLLCMLKGARVPLGCSPQLSLAALLHQCPDQCALATPNPSFPPECQPAT